MQANLNIISNLNFILVCLNRIVKALSDKKRTDSFPVSPFVARFTANPFSKRQGFCRRCHSANSCRHNPFRQR